MFLAKLYIFSTLRLKRHWSNLMSWTFQAIALWMTPDDPCMSLDPINALHSSQEFFDPWLTPADLCVTFDPSNALCFGQGFFLPNLGATGHSLAIWPLVDPYMTFNHSKCTSLRSGVLPTKFGAHRAIWALVYPGWPLHDLCPQQCNIFGQCSSYQIWCP